MKTTYALHLRAFPVEIKDNRTGEKSDDIVVLDRNTLDTAQGIGMSYEQVIWKLYNLKGYLVISIGKPTKKTVDADLAELFKEGRIE